MYYAQAIVGGAHRVASLELPPRVAGMDGRLDAIGGAFHCFWRFAPIFLPALDLIQALLAVDPATGELNLEGVVEGRSRATVDERTGRTRLEPNETGGVEGAMRRAARFREYVESRAARSGLERELLAWLWRDPVCGRSIEEWLWACEVEDPGLPPDEEGRNFVTITWTAQGGGGGGGGDTSTSTVTLDDIEEDLETWAFQLCHLAFLLAAVFDAEVGALGREAGVDLMAHGRVRACLLPDVGQRSCCKNCTIEQGTHAR